MPKRLDVLDPLFILPISIAVFFALSFYAYKDISVSKFLNFNIGGHVFIYAFLGLLFLAIGIMLGKRYEKKFFILPKIIVYLFLSVLLYDIIGMWSFIAVLFILLLADAIGREYSAGIPSRVLLFVGLISGLLCFYSLGGIPLFDMALRGGAHNGFYMVSFYSAASGLCLAVPSLSRGRAYVLLFSSGLFFSLWGYRNDVLEILACGIFVMYYTRKISLGGFALIVTLFGSILLFLGMSQIGSTGQAWKIENPLQLLLFRFGFTLGIFSRIGEEVSLFGEHMGSLWHIEGLRPPLIIGHEVAGYGAKINSTIFGPSLFDGGILELAIVLFAVGFIMGYLHNLKKSDFAIGIYSLALAMVLGTVEIGLYYYDMITLAVAFFLALPRIAETFPILDVDRIRKIIFNS